MIMTKEYREEKRRLENVAADYLRTNGYVVNKVLYPIKDGVKIPLEMDGKPQPTELYYIVLNECDDVQVVSRIEDADDTDIDFLGDFGNDEMKRILDEFGIKY